ncbi:CSC1-like protein 1, partial [Clonorchis sinensis]
ASDVERTAGLDAVHYLRFLSYLIAYTAVTMVFCLTVILPLNIKGTLKSPDLQSFGVTTISNLPGESQVLWAHVVFGFLYFIVAFFLMQHFSKVLWHEAPKAKIVSHRTLMISGISRSHCQRDLISRHFREAYPSCEVDDIQVCYDIRRLVDLDNKWETAETSLKFSRRRFEAKGVRPVMIPRCCGWSCTNCYHRGHCRFCFAPPRHLNTFMYDTNCDDEATAIIGSGVCCNQCQCPTPVDAISYYARESEQLRKLIEEEGSRAVKTKIGIAFVTFATKEAATRVYRSYHSGIRCNMDLPRSSVSTFLRSRSWTVVYAPTPSNIIWQNLAISRTVWWVRAVAVNLFVFIIVFFLTTPTYVLNLVNKLRLTERLQINDPFVIQFIPSIILWSVSALLPLLVYNSDRLVGHWTRSTLHLTVMTKTFILLILMVLVLPSLGLTSIPALLQWLFPEMRWVPLQPSDQNSPPQTLHFNLPSAVVSTPRYLFTSMITPTVTPPITSPWIPIGPQSFQWECVFMPDNGAFFVNYVITSAFFGTALQLARLPELFLYACRIMCVRSQAEKASVRKASQWEFDFGLYYAWTLCVFAVVSAYSILCPLITPFGLIYLIFKYLVDRHNLFYAYLPSRIDSRIHWLAINFMLAAVLLLQLNLFMFIAIRLGAIGNPLSITALVGLILSGLMWITTIVTGWVFVGSSATRFRRTSTAHSGSPVDTDSGELVGTSFRTGTTMRVTDEYYAAVDRTEQLDLDPRMPTKGPVNCPISSTSVYGYRHHETASSEDLIGTGSGVGHLVSLQTSSPVKLALTVQPPFIAPVLLNVTEVTHTNPLSTLPNEQ